jgi:SAM-dependent methyltransferase
MAALRKEAPDWRRLSIHESSPAARGVSLKLKAECAGYVPTQFFTDVQPGTLYRGMRCETLESQTFADATFDLVITQDVLEHVFYPDRVHQEIWRTLKPGGLHIFTTPIYKGLLNSERRAGHDENGAIVHLFPLEYHGNPIDDAGSLVTFHYGYDISEMIAAAAPFDVEIRRFNDRTSGIVGEFTEVIICRKRP